MYITIPREKKKKKHILRRLQKLLFMYIYLGRKKFFPHYSPHSDLYFRFYSLSMHEYFLCYVHNKTGQLLEPSLISIALREVSSVIFFFSYISKNPSSPLS